LVTLPRKTKYSKAKTHSLGSTTSTEWTTLDSRNTPSPTNPGEEGVADAPGKDGNASMREQVKRPNPWKKMMMMMMMMMKQKEMFLS
jgi:hypothetical protein